MIKVEVTQDIDSCLMLRRKVFIEEQNVTEEEELDGLEDVATHLLASEEGRPLGSARLLTDGEIGKIGRVCVLIEARGKGIGAALIKAAVEQFRSRPEIKKVKLGAQTHALAFYEKLGFTAYGPEYLDANIPHRDMVMELR